MFLPDIRKVDVSGKRVFLRADTDVPFISGEIEDDTRLRAWFPTLQYLLEHNSTVIIGGKLGRPEGESYESRSKNHELSLKPVAQWLFERFKIYDLRFKKIKIGDFDAWYISPQIILLENLQFYKEETENDKEFAKKLADLSEIYVNDAFAVSHRNNASVVGIAEIMPHYAGLHLQEEIKILSNILEQPKRPLVVVVGGAKIETKLPLVIKMADHADYVLVGGKIAMEREKLKEVQNEKLHVADLNFDGTDISESSVKEFKEIIGKAKTIVWNGPLGQIRNSKFEIRNSEQSSERGTREIARAISESTAYTVVGGGDTIGFIHRNNLMDKFPFVSMGGGAMLAFLSGVKLPGLEALRA